MPGKRTLTEPVAAPSGPETLGAYPHASTISSLTGVSITVVEKASTWWRVEVKSGPHTGKTGWIMSNYFEIA